MIAVGVENIQTLETLQRLGVKLIQGYFFAKPNSKVNSINSSIKEKLEELTQETIS